MFIKLKSQSNGLEHEVIRERDIFTKKRKGPKLFLSALVFLGVAGYFYYLNFGNPFQTNKTPVVAESQSRSGSIESVTDRVIKAFEGSEDKQRENTNSFSNDPEPAIYQASEIDDTITPALANTSTDITGQSPISTDSEVADSLEQSKKSSPIETIPNMITDVFAETENKQEKATITNSVESDYQGESVEALTEPSYDLISSDAPQSTALETHENGTDKTADQNIEDGAHISAVQDDLLSIFEGVDSINAAEIPAKKNPESKKLIQTEVAAVQQTGEQDQVEQIRSEPNLKTDPTVANVENTAITQADTSTISIKDLYDQLMTDLDNQEVQATEVNTTNESVTAEQIPVEENTARETLNDINQTDNSSAAALNKLGHKESSGTNTGTTIDPDQSLAMADTINTHLTTEPETTVITNSESESVEGNDVELAYISSTQLSDNKGSTPLMIAVLNSDNQTVRELVQQGARINARNDWGWTALLNATIKGNRPMVEYLLKNGASPHLVDNGGRSPLMAAVLNNHPQIVKTLLLYKADVNKANRDGWTALSFAAWKGDTLSVKYLLEADAFKHHQTAEGFTPLQLAKQGNHTEVINLLNQ